jgi:RHS repeat-associated protein
MSSAVEPAGLGAAVVTTSMDTPTTLQVVEYYHLDAVGSVRAVTDADGTVIARHDFRPFGEELSPQIPPHDRKLFTGQERDFETGLDYFYARQLRVQTGRFTTPDPVTDLAWTDPTLGATNAYGYVNNNPLRFIDPTGAQCQNGDKGTQELCHPSYWQKDQYMVWGPSGYYCDNCFMLVEQVGANAVQQSTVAQPLTPMGAGVLSFYPGRGPTAGVGIGANGPATSPAGGQKNPGHSATECFGIVAREDGAALLLDGLATADLLAPAAMALSMVAIGNSAFHKDAGGAIAGAVGFDIAPMAWTGGRLGETIPVIGQLFGAVMAIRDGVKAFNDFETCYRGQ